MKRYKKYAGILVLLGLAVLVAAYFRPRSLGDILAKLDKDPDPDGTVYCTFFDISQNRSEDWNVPRSELLSSRLLGPLLSDVSLSGPIAAGGGGMNSDLANLYFSLPQKDGSYRKVTVELVLSYGDTKDRDSGSCSAFVNMDGGGYFVTSGKQAIPAFLDRARQN